MASFIKNKLKACIASDDGGDDFGQVEHLRDFHYAIIGNPDFWHRRDVQIISSCSRILIC